MLRRSIIALTAAPTLLLTPVVRAGAQLAPAPTSANGSASAPGLISCEDTQTGAGVASGLLAGCSINPDGATASGSATVTPGIGGGIFTTASVSGTTTNGVVARGDGTMTGFITLNGGIANTIYRVFMTAAYTNTETDGASTFDRGFATVTMDVGRIFSDGSLVHYDALISSAMGTSILESVVETRFRTFFYSIGVHSNVLLFQGDGFADATSSMFTPTLRVESLDGADITNQFTMVYDPADGIAPVTATPEPASMALMGTGLIGLWGVRFRRRKQ